MILMTLHSAYCSAHIPSHSTLLTATEGARYRRFGAAAGIRPRDGPVACIRPWTDGTRLYNVAHVVKSGDESRKHLFGADKWV